jgi:hypothetical protein
MLKVGKRKLKTVNRLRKNKANKANKNVKRTIKKTRKSSIDNGGKDKQKGGQRGEQKDNFEVTTLRSIDQDRLNQMKISNYVNNNIDYGILPGPPPTDCCIM